MLALLIQFNEQVPRKNRFILMFNDLGYSPKHGDHKDSFRD